MRVRDWIFGRLGFSSLKELNGVAYYAIPTLAETLNPRPTLWPAELIHSVTKIKKMYMLNYQNNKHFSPFQGYKDSELHYWQYSLTMIRERYL